MSMMNYHMKMNRIREEYIFTKGSDRILSILYTKRSILAYETYYFCIEESVSEDIGNIKERNEDFNIFKEYFGKIKPYVT